MTAPHKTNNNNNFMAEALRLAKLSKPSPNPRVGAVLVKENHIVGRGFHKNPGSPHAEIEAITNAGQSAAGADLYVTLEPCCHTGRTGPCTEAIHAASIRHVFVGMLDPDQKMRGQGVKILKKLGHQVTVGILEATCKELLRGYLIHRTLGRPEIILKAAVSLDGYLASSSGNSKWISSETSRIKAHSMRAFSDAVLVGIETVLIDNPMLTVRHKVDPYSNYKNPLRVVMDSMLRTPMESNLVKTAHKTPLLLAYTKAPETKVAALKNIPGIQTLQCPPTTDNRVDPIALARKLANIGILSLLVEGGGVIHGAFAKAGIADRFSLFIAPKIFGSGKRWISFEGTDIVSNALSVANLDVTTSGIDLLLEGLIKQPHAK